MPHAIVQWYELHNKPNNYGKVFYHQTGVHACWIVTKKKSDCRFLLKAGCRPLYIFTTSPLLYKKCSACNFKSSLWGLRGPSECDSGGVCGMSSGKSPLTTNPGNSGAMWFIINPILMESYFIIRLGCMLVEHSPRRTGTSGSCLMQVADHYYDTCNQRFR